MYLHAWIGEAASKHIADALMTSRSSVFLCVYLFVGGKREIDRIMGLGMSSSVPADDMSSAAHGVAGRRYMVQYARCSDGPAVAVPVDLPLTATVGQLRDRVAQSTGVPKGLQAFRAGGGGEPLALPDDAVTLQAARLPQLIELRRKTASDCLEDVAARVAALGPRVASVLAVAPPHAPNEDARLLAELLTREQMSLDAIDPGDDAALRGRRREVIRAAQGHIDALDRGCIT